MCTVPRPIKGLVLVGHDDPPFSTEHLPLLGRQTPSSRGGGYVHVSHIKTTLSVIGQYYDGEVCL